MRLLRSINIYFTDIARHTIANDIQYLLVIILGSICCSFEVQAQSKYKYTHQVVLEQSCTGNYEDRYYSSSLAPYAIAMTDTNIIVMNIYDTTHRVYNLILMDWKGSILDARRDKYGFAETMYYNKKRSLLYVWYPRSDMKSNCIVYDSLLNIRDSISIKNKPTEFWSTATGVFSKKEINILKKVLRNCLIPFYKTDENKNWDLTGYIAYADEDYIILKNNYIFLINAIDRNKLFSRKRKQNLLDLYIDLTPTDYVSRTLIQESEMSNCNRGKSPLSKNYEYATNGNVALYGKHLVKSFIFFNPNTSWGRDYVYFGTANP